MRDYFRIMMEADDGTTIPAGKPELKEQPEPTINAPEPEVAKYTDSQLNDLVKKNAAKEAVKILSEAGLESTGNLKDDVAKFKAWKESQMTEAEKYKTDLEAEKAKTKEVEARATAAELRAEIVGKGVPADKADRIMKLAQSYEGETPAEKVTAVLADFPELVKGAQSIGVENKGASPNAEQALLDQMLKNAGITKKS